MKLKHLMLILATIAGFSSVKAADTTTVPDGWTYVKFNPDVRYSQWVLDSRLGDFYGNTNQMGFATYDINLVQKTTPNWTKGISMDYVAGLVAKAAIENAAFYKAFDWSKPWFKSVEWYANQPISVPTSGGSLDNLNAAKMFFGLYALATREFAANADAKTASNALTQLGNAQKGLKDHNDRYSFKSGANLNGKDISGGWFHKSSYTNQMWLDGQYMGPALLAQLKNEYSGYSQMSDDDWTLITKQFTSVWEQCWDENEKLLYHAFASDNSTAKYSATWAGDAEIWTTAHTDKSKWQGMAAGGHSAAFWGRAEGWYFLALVDVLEQMKNAGEENSANYSTLKTYLDKLAEGIKARQDARTGCWYQLLAKDATYSAQYYNGQELTSVSNYLESSCTAIFTAAYLKAIRLGLLAEDAYMDVAEKAYKGFVENFMVRKADGTVTLTGCSRSAGLGGAAMGETKFRDGSNAYYLLGYDVKPTTASDYTEGKVLGGFILAATEYERLHEKQNVPMLLIDLHPSYTVANGETAKLEVKVSGATLTSYQWFKGNWDNPEKIEGATAATYNPTVSGTYFCEVIADNSSAAKSNAAARAATTIRSSVTEVTVAEGTEGGDVSNGTVSYTVWYGSNADKPEDVVEGNFGTLSKGTKSHIHSFTIDGIEYTITQGSQLNPTLTFTVQDGQTGAFYLSVASSGSGERKFTLKKGDADYNIEKSVKGTTPTLVDYKELPVGTYTLTVSGGNITLGFLCLALTSEASGTTLSSDLQIKDGTNGTTKCAYFSNNSTWTPAVGGTINLSDIVASSSTGAYSSSDKTIAEVYDGQLVAHGSGTVTLTQDADATHAAGSVKINIARGSNVAKDGTNSFSFPAGTVVSDGMTIAREDIKMTFGNDGFWGKAGTDNGYTNGQVMPQGVDNSPYIPTAGTFYQFTPAKDGSLAVKVNLGEKKALHISEGGNLIVAKTDDDKEIGQGTVLAAKYTGNVTFDVKAGKEYYVYAVGSKLGFYGFEFTPAPPVLNVKFDKASVTYYKDEQATAVVAPKLVVMYDEKELGKDKYTVAYSSSDESVVKVTSGGEPTIVGVGSAVITATVTPNDTEYGTNTLTAQYKFTVRDFDAPVVRAYPLTVYNTTGVQPMPVIDIYAHDHEQLVNLDKRYYTLKYEWKSGDKIVDTTGGGFVLDGEESNWTLGQAVVNVTVTPTEEAAKRFRISETTTDFRVVVIEAGAKLVPTFGGVSTGRMTTNNTTEGREFITPVIYNGVDISSGFDVIYEITDNGGTGSELKNASNGKVTSSGSKINDNVRHTVTLLSGSKDGTVTIKVTAKPTKDYASQYQEITKEIKVEVYSLLKKFSGVTINPATLKLQVGNVYTDFEVEVKDEQGNVMTDGYTLEWVSTVPGVAAIKDREKGGVRTLFDGTTRIMAFVKHPEYSDMRAVCVLTVTDPGMFKVSGNTKYAVGTEMGNENITVTLGGWMFNGNTQELFRPYGTTTEGMGDNLWGAPTTSTKKPVGFTHNIGMGDMKNARQENGSNCRPECKELYNATMVEQDYKLLDKMFNVPCYGSYIALSPKTNGKVMVYVRQNGVFDKSDGSAVYRPQRRLFVMDEMGNFVPSTPKMEYPTPWGDNGIGESDKAKITCDLFKTKDGSNNFYEIAKEKFPKDEQTTAAQNFVKSHFVGLNNFSTANFQNGVYASALPYDLVKNPLIKGKSGDDKGLTESTEELAKRGWSVLSVAPVSYTFDIKAGKTYYVYNFGSKLGFYGYKFRQADVTVKEYDWKEAEENTVENTVENTDQYHVAKVSIDREFKAGTWAVCVLPFSMNRLQINEVFGHVYDKNTPEGTQIMYFDRVEGTTIHFVRHAYNTIVAGKPFLIRPTKDAKITSENMGNFPYVTIEAAGKPAEWGRQNDLGYSWVSDYSPQTFSYGDYYLSNTGDMKRMTGTSNTLKGFRSFLKANTDAARAKVLKVSSSNNVDPDDVSTAIEGLMMDSDGNLFEVPVSGTVYSLSGQVVTTDATKLYSLPAGIYVVNGRKYVVK